MRPDQFPARLRAARVASGLSQTRLAGLIDAPASDISRWENGHADPSEYVVRLLAKALSVDAVWLAGVPRRRVTVAEVIRRGTH